MFWTLVSVFTSLMPNSFDNFREVDAIHYEKMQVFFEASGKDLIKI